MRRKRWGWGNIVFATRLNIVAAARSSQLELPRGKGAAQRLVDVQLCTECSNVSHVEQQQCYSRQQGSRRRPSS
jgi:hypothetical protein